MRSKAVEKNSDKNMNFQKFAKPYPNWSREELYILAREFGIPNYEHIQEDILIEMLNRRLN